MTELVKIDEPFKPLLPDIAGFSETFKLSEAWSWASPRVPVAVEPMAPGKRVVYHKSDPAAGGDVLAFFDGRMQDEDDSDVVEQLSRVESDFIVDGYVSEGKYLAHEILWWDGKPVNDLPYAERRGVLENFRTAVGAVADGPLSVDIVGSTIINSKEELGQQALKIFQDENSTGVVMKKADSPYPLTGKTTDWFAALLPEVSAGELQMELVTKENGSANLDFRILKQSPTKQLITAVVLRPNIFDEGGDIMTPEDVEFACHHFMRHNGVIGFRHGKLAPAEPVESYIAPVDFELDGEQIKKGDWVIVIFVEDKEFWNKEILSGNIQGVSVGGFGKKTKISA